MNAAKLLGGLFTAGSLILNLGAMIFNSASHDIELKQEVQKEVAKQIANIRVIRK